MWTFPGQGQCPCRMDPRLITSLPPCFLPNTEVPAPTLSTGRHRVTLSSAALNTLLFGGVLGKVLKQNDIYVVRYNIIKAIKVHYFTHPHNLSILLYLICDKIVEKGYLM